MPYLTFKDASLLIDRGLLHPDNEVIYHGSAKDAPDSDDLKKKGINPTDDVYKVGISEEEIDKRTMKAGIEVARERGKKAVKLALAGAAVGAMVTLI